MKKRIIPFILAVSVLVSGLVLPTSAVAALPGGVAAGATAVIKDSSFANAVGQLCKDTVEHFGGEATSEFVQRTLDAVVSMVGVGNLPYNTLVQKCASLNEIAHNPIKYSEFLYDVAYGSDSGGFNPPSQELFRRILVYVMAYNSNLTEWKVVSHSDYGYVITNGDGNFVLSDSLGQFPYCLESTDKWLGSRTALSASTIHLQTDYSLKNLQAIHESLYPDWAFRRTNVTLQDGKYTVLQAASDGIHFDQILCDALGFPYGIPQNDTQMGNDRDYNNDKEGQPEVSEDPIVDIDGDLVMQMFPDGSFTWINSLIYDAANKTYNIDASSTYNTENNYYYSYEWNYTYHIDYTSITYIGQTEEYDKYYEYYYDLPDGRSSADLTADELLALNTSIDVLPYIRSADDVSIRALYHFDGDTRDSSYWSHLGSLKWNKGATLTYMDVGTFNGALYLDENEHDFTIQLPSSVGDGDFTLQFRIYQSATAAPVTDSYVYYGNYALFSFDGANIKNASGTALSSMPVGTWNELCFMRQGGKYAWFLNGVRTFHPAA